MSSANSSLRPAWHRGNQSGRGFQPPPTVASERNRSQSIGSDPGRRDSNFNKFAALDDDEDGVADKGEDTQPKPSGNSRSEALRSSLISRGSSTGAKPGRSLADLAARVPERDTRTSGGYSGNRFGSLRNNNEPISTSTSSVDPYKPDAKVIRYTREKLLSMRPPPSKTIPDCLKSIEGTVILSPEPLDPVCWDTFDGEEIWNSVPRRGSGKATGSLREMADGTDPRRLNATGTRRDSGASSGRWARGVALPPPDAVKKVPREKEAENPNDLWDDPATAGAATDFSAFGSMPEEDSKDGGTSDDTFDFEKMAEQTRKFEEEVHGRSSRTNSDADSEDLANPVTVKVDPKRPLASAGTTIHSGSGDNVNVFEDFDDPSEPQEPPPAIKAADEDPSASSRLMAMIGVTKDVPEDEPAADSVEPAPVELPVEPSVEEPPDVSIPVEEPKTISPWALPETDKTAESDATEGFVIPLNPWGSQLMPQPPQQGLDLQARLREAELEQKARDAELLRQQEEAQRRALAQQQAEEHARQQAQAAAIQQQQQQQQQQREQQAGVQSQVELVLMERISTILENSWGRSDLMSILSTLHAEDSRVIPLLSNVDAMRALIMRNPRRVALRQDPAFGAEMAILLVTNSQWQQQQAEARARQEQLQRQEQQRRLEEEQQKAAAARAQSELRNLTVVPDAPWYYSDPQNNIQGPFRGEEMRQWLEAGYFKGDLPISQTPTGTFHPLSAIFSDLSVAFASQNDTAAEEARAKAEQEERARLEAERIEAERAEAEAKAREAAERERERERLHREKEAKASREAAERERRAREEAEAREPIEREMRAREAAEAAERERRAKEAAEAAERERLAAEAASTADSSNGGNESSAQLKMMLGLSSEAMSAASDHVPASDPWSVKANDKQRSPVKRWSVNEPLLASDLHALTSAKPAGSAWGGAGKPGPRKSMSEIQQEEARASARLARQREASGRSSSSGWANVAASRGGSTGWSSGAVKPTAAAVVASAATMTAPAPVQARPIAQSAKPFVTPVQAPVVSSQAQRSNVAPANAADEFGATMSPALEKWCKDQLMKLNGTDDLTLVSFCMTLEDPIEIRQYLTAYLGSTAQVNSFASDFINKKGGSRNKQEEWETTGSGKKKGRKKR